MTQTKKDVVSRPMRINGVSSQRIDRRRAKDYALELRVNFSLGEHEYCANCLDNQGVRLYLADIAKGLPNLNGRYTWASTINCYYGQTCPDCNRTDSMVNSLSIEFRVPADRPSEILSESCAQRAIAKACPENQGKNTWDDTFLSLEQILAQRVLALFAKRERDIERCQVAKEASSLVTQLYAESDKQARINIGWEEKLEALRAELRAEQEACLRENIGSLEMDCIASDGDWHPLAIKLAAEKAVSENLPAAFPGFLRCNDRPTVQMSDVVLPGDPEPDPENIS